MGISKQTAVALLLAAAGLWWLAYEWLTTAPLQFQVVDADSGEVVSDVHAVYYVRAYEGSLGGGGGRHANLAIVEPTAHRNGELSVPAQHIELLPLWNYEYPNVIVFKQGYEPAYARRLWASARIVPRLEDVLRWGKSERTLKLRKSSDPDRLRYALDSLQVELEAFYAYNNTDRCAWKRIATAIVAFEKQATLLEARDGTKRSTPLRQLLDAEAQGGAQSKLIRNCGPVRDFFQNLPKSIGS